MQLALKMDSSFFQKIAQYNPPIKCGNKSNWRNLFDCAEGILS